MAVGDTGKKGTPSGANAGMEKNSQVNPAARGAKSGTSMTRKGSKGQSQARSGKW